MTLINKNTRLKKLLSVFAILFNTNFLAISIFVSEPVYAVISFFVWFLLFSYGVFIKKDLRINRSLALFCLFLISCVIMTMLVNSDFSIQHFIVIMHIFCALVLILYVDFDMFVEVYVKVFYILAAISLVCHIAVRTFPELLNYGTTITNSVGARFQCYYVYFYAIDGESFRNWGIASEPGDYQFYLNLALYFYLFVLKDSRKISKIQFLPAVILSATVVSTFSSVGLVFLFCIWAAYFLNNIKSKKHFLILLCSIVCLLIAVLISDRLRYLINEYAIKKLTGESSSSLSYRVLSMVAGARIGLSYPIFGAGYDKSTQLLEGLYSSMSMPYNHTSTTFSLFSIFGLTMMLLLTIPFFYVFLKKYKFRLNLLSKFLIIIGVFMAINNQRYVWDPMYYIIVFYGVDLYIKKRVKTFI